MTSDQKQLLKSISEYFNSKEYKRSRRPISDHDLAKFYKIDINVIRATLNIFFQKGYIFLKKKDHSEHENGILYTIYRVEPEGDIAVKNF